MLGIALAVGVVLLLGRLIEWLNHNCWALVFGDAEKARRAAFLLVAPGVVVHELAHYVMALALGERVTRVDLFHPVYDAASGHWRLGSVEHTAAPDPWRNLLIGAAPLIAGPGALVALLLMLGAPFPHGGDPLAVAGGFVTALAASGWKAPLVFYAFLNLGTTVLVSPADMRDLRPAAFLGLPLLLLGWLLLLAAPAAWRITLAGALGQLADAGLSLLFTMVIADLLAVVALAALYRLLALRTRSPRLHR